MSLILLDTHVAVWSVAGNLPPSIAKLVNSAASRGELLLSPISAWEIGMLVEKRRLVLGPPLHEFIRSLYERTGVVTAALTPAIAVTASVLPGRFRGDPADRMLIATATAYGAQLATRDARVLDYAKSHKALRCIRC